MPKVPLASSTQTVEPTPLASVRQSQPSSSRAFGTGLGEALQRTGAAIDEIALQQLAVQNETRAKQLDVEFSQSLREMQFNPETGYYAKRGEDAFKNQPLIEQSITELQKQFLSRAENDSQRAMLAKSLTARGEQARNGVARHAAKEYEAWIDSASEARAKDTIDDIVANYSNPEAVTVDKDGNTIHMDERNMEVLRQAGRNEIISKAERKGWDPALTNQELEVYDTAVYSGIIETMMQQNPKKARQYFEAVKGRIDGKEHAKLLRALNVAENGDLATNWEDYARLGAMAADNRSQFVNEDIDKYQLSNSHRAYFMNLQRATRSNWNKANEQVSGIGKAMSQAKRSLEAAGIKTTAKAGKNDKQLLEQFQGALLEEIEGFRAQNDGRFPDEATVQGFIDSLLIKGTYQDDRLLAPILPDKQGFVFQGPNEEGKAVTIPIDEIPETDRASIKSALEKRGIAPTDEQIRFWYTAAQIENARRNK